LIITETERLILRRFTAEDKHAVFQLNSIPEILTYIPGEPMSSVDQAETILKDLVFPGYEKFGFGRWAVEHKADNKVIGFCGPTFVQEFNEVELGYRYLPEYWGTGIGFEAANAALSVIPSFDINHVIALILLGNRGSEALARKVGMTERGRDSFMGHKVNVFEKQL
jgi:RimJ/RimL family protein N-acetyltransferase